MRGGVRCVATRSYELTRRNQHLTRNKADDQTVQCSAQAFWFTPKRNADVPLQPATNTRADEQSWPTPQNIPPRDNPRVQGSLPTTTGLVPEPAQPERAAQEHDQCEVARVPAQNQLLLLQQRKVEGRDGETVIELHKRIAQIYFHWPRIAVS